MYSLGAIINIVAYELSWDGGVPFMAKHTLWTVVPVSVQRGSPVLNTYRSLPTPVLAWVIGDLQRKFTGSKGCFSANVHFGLFQSRGGDSDSCLN